MEWMKKCYSRLLIDNHITDLKPEFMRQFAPAEYVRMVKMAGVDAAMVYACCHNGNCYYPTRVGHMHAGLEGRDIFGETVQLLRKNGIVPVAYYTSIYHNNSAKSHPAWRITYPDGSQHGGRYWWSCPNNDEYVKFTIAQISEVTAYDVDGIFNDMTFWPGICVCPCCREKYRAETGREIPVKIDWRAPEWISFQRFRERSMAAFTQAITSAVKAKKNITVTHQTSTIMHGWMQGYTLDIADACDYTSGDFYGGKYQHILGAKVLAAAARSQPYEFMTSRCVNLRDHTSMKSEAQLTAEAATTLANAGAYFFIDAINPDGTLEEPVYQRLGAVSKTLSPFTRTIQRHRPVISAGTALYYSSAAYIDENASADIMLPGDNKSAVDELTGTSIILTRAHIPFAAVTGRSDLSAFRTIIMNNILYTTPEENEKLRTFVKNGGTLIATGNTSLMTPDGSTTGDFALADVFGVSTVGTKAKRFHYLSFIDRCWLISSPETAPLVKTTSADVIAYINEPVFDPDDSEYASIHSNPPGIDTGFAGLTVNKYGKGKCIYLSSPVLSLQQDAQQVFGAWLFREHASSTMIVETNDPECVEITILKSTMNNAIIVGLVNYQKELPNVPVHDISVKLCLNEIKPVSAVRVSDGVKLNTAVEDGTLCINVPFLETIEMIEINME